MRLTENRLRKIIREELENIWSRFRNKNDLRYVTRDQERTANRLAKKGWQVVNSHFITDEDDLEYYRDEHPQTTFLMLGVQSPLDGATLNVDPDGEIYNHRGKLVKMTRI